jgi:hypothetical protein
MEKNQGRMIHQRRHGVAFFFRSFSFLFWFFFVLFKGRATKDGRQEKD